jgi:hypothetical protein
VLGAAGKSSENSTCALPDHILRLANVRQADFGLLGFPTKSLLEMLGKLQYIIPIPDGNHRVKNRDSATPSHRCTKMMDRLTISEEVRR